MGQDKLKPVREEKRKAFICPEYICRLKTNLEIIPRKILEIVWDMLSSNKILESRKKDSRTFY